MNAQPEFLAAQTFEAVFTKEQVDELEQAAKDPSHGINRRIGLHLLTRTKAEMLEKMDLASCEALENWLEASKTYREHLEAVCDVMRSAEMRALCVMAAWLQEHPEDETQH